MLALTTTNNQQCLWVCNLVCRINDLCLWHNQKLIFSIIFSFIVLKICELAYIDLYGVTLKNACILWSCTYLSYMSCYFFFGYIRSLYNTLSEYKVKMTLPLGRMSQCSFGYETLMFVCVRWVYLHTFLHETWFSLSPIHTDIRKIWPILLTRGMVNKTKMNVLVV